MSNINLLPDDLRKREEKELQRISKRPSKKQVEWNNPSKKGSVDLYSDVPEESLWSRIFGTKNPVATPEPESKLDMKPVQSPVIEQSKQVNTYNFANIPKPPKIKEKAKFSFSDLFGVSSSHPQSPIKPSIQPAIKTKNVSGVDFSPLERAGQKDKVSFWEKIFGSNKKYDIFEPIGSGMAKSSPQDGDSYKKYSADFSKMKKELPVRSKPNKIREEDSWFNVLGSMFIPKRKKKEWKMTSGSNSRDRLIKDSLLLSKDKAWENYSTSKDYHSQKSSHSPNNKAQKGLHNAISNNKEKKKNDGRNKSQHGKYHLAPKKEATGININLIPEELIAVRKPSLVSHMISLLFIIVLAGSVVGGLYYFIDYNQSKINREIVAKTQKMEQLNSELKEYHQAQIENYNVVKKILIMDEVLNNHLYWTKFFLLLEKYTLDSTYYPSFSASVSGKFSLPVSTKDYASALAQIAALKQASDFTKDIQVDSMHIISDSKKGAYGVGFDLKINLADSVFKK